MGPIVCATRGGEASRRTQQQAIALAKERGAKLVFLSVVNPESVGPVDGPLGAALADEMKRLARSLLRIAQARALEQGVKAQALVRSGPVWQSIEDALRQLQASALVIGMPRQGEEAEIFEPEDMQVFVAAVRRDLGIEVVVA